MLISPQTTDEESRTLCRKLLQACFPRSQHNVFEEQTRRKEHTTVFKKNMYPQPRLCFWTCAVRTWKVPTCSEHAVFARAWPSLSCYCRRRLPNFNVLSLMCIRPRMYLPLACAMMHKLLSMRRQVLRGSNRSRHGHDREANAAANLGTCGIRMVLGMAPPAYLARSNDHALK